MPIFLDLKEKVLFGFVWVSRFMEDRPVSDGVNALCVRILKFK